MPLLISLALAVMMAFAGIRFWAGSPPSAAHQEPHTEVAPIGTVTVQGAVNHPGRFPLKPGATLLSAIAGAGGPTDIARPRKTTLLRNGVSIRHNLEEEEITNPTLLQDGDTITVPEERY